MFKFWSRFLLLCVVCLSLPAIAAACDPPYVGINGIGDGQALSGVQTLSLSVWSETEVMGVDVYLDGKLIIILTPVLGRNADDEYAGSCAFAWDTSTFPDGAHEVYAKARAIGREDGVSDPIAVTIDNQMTPFSQSSTEAEMPDQGQEEDGQEGEQAPDLATGAEQ